MKQFQLNEYYLYEAEPKDFNLTNMPYHCRNWIFRLKPNPQNGKYYMHDTYWGHDEHAIEVTSENVDLFKPLFDTRDFVKIPNDDEQYMYKKEDVFVVRDQNQFNNRISVYLRKNAKKSTEYQIRVFENRLSKKKHELNTVQREYDEILNELKRLKNYG